MLDRIEESIRAKGFSYQRIDGQSTLKARSNAMQIFSEDANCTVMLASIGSAGEGYVKSSCNHVAQFIN
jgi:SNF2 family DNA or RNA helicase